MAEWGKSVVALCLATLAAGCSTHGGYVTYSARRQYMHDHCTEDPFADYNCDSAARDLLGDSAITPQDSEFANSQLAKPSLLPPALVIQERGVSPGNPTWSSPVSSNASARATATPTFSGVACKRRAPTQWECKRANTPGAMAMFRLGGTGQWQCRTTPDFVACALSSPILADISDETLEKKLKGWKCDHNSAGELECIAPSPE